MPLDTDGPGALRHAERHGGPPVLDAGVLASLRELGGGHDGLLFELIELFLMDVSERGQELLAATDAEDTMRVKAIAHALKSSSANLGALPLSKACADIEAAAHREDAATCALLVVRVGGMLAVTCAALTALRLEDSPQPDSHPGPHPNSHPAD